MIGDELAIEQGVMTDAEAGDEPGKRDLRRVGAAAEHRFAEKGAAQLDPVETAHQRAVVPAFDRVGMAGGMEVARGLFDGGIDPRFAAIGAGGHDRVEGGVVRPVTSRGIRP